ncbi:MAG TPA: NAD(P)H-hydrate epimerase [Tepidisphaeraceae bacterium]|nr:NAD(P)H-hydrate epimerase [Tepidisphaeraceae bacterium]
MIRLTRAQVRQIDRRAIDEYHIPGIVLMENAARSAVDVARGMLRREGLRSALILCGGGNNGGDGLAIARHLHNRGTPVFIGLATDPASYKGDALINWRIASAMGLRHAPATPQFVRDHSRALIIDAIFGTGLSESPRPPFDALCKTINDDTGAVLAVDVPSGLDCDTGKPLGPCICANVTVTFVAEKLGFSNPVARRFVGDVVVGDIGCPPELIEAVAAAAL